MPDEDSAAATPAGRIPQWFGAWANVVAPASVLSALLFYFGYVAARAQYEYFGVDVDVVGLSTQEYIMRSPQPLLVPLLALTLVGAGLLVGHTKVRERLRIAAAAAVRAGDTPERAAGRRRLRRLRRVLRTTTMVGLGVLGLGVLLVLAYAGLGDWAVYNLATPVVIATGGALVGYGWRCIELIDAAAPAPAGPTGNSSDSATGDIGATADPATAEPATAEPAGAQDAAVLRRAARILIHAVTAVSVFWAAATVAQWSGRGLAEEMALNLDRLPRVILDTKERLYVRSPGVEEWILPAEEGQTFRYRYRRLRLLVMGHDRMFLVPEEWSTSNSTLVAPINDSVRVQFQFQNQPP